MQTTILIVEEQKKKGINPSINFKKIEESLKPRTFCISEKDIDKYRNYSDLEEIIDYIDDIDVTFSPKDIDYIDKNIHAIGAALDKLYEFVDDHNQG